MSTFLPNIPAASDNLDFSQGQLQTNNQALDAIFGTDHYKFSDVTANQGFHNKVTTPPIVGGVPATATNPIFYGFQQTAPLGLLQYSRGPSNAIPTPLTMVQSGAPQTIGGGASVNILDFNGILSASGMVYAGSTTATQFAVYFITYDNASGNFQINNIKASGFTVSNNVKVLILTNSTGVAINNVVFTLQLFRTQ